MKKFIICGISLVLLSILGCIKQGEKPMEGKLVGITASMSLSDAAKGEIKDLYYEGKLELEMKDGKKIEALCNKDLVKTLVGDQILQVKYDDKLKSYVVVKALPYSK
jgi:hypothetical protein